MLTYAKQSYVTFVPNDVSKNVKLSEMIAKENALPFSSRFGPFSDRFRIVFGPFRILSDRFQSVSECFGSFRTVFGSFRIVFGPFRIVFDPFRIVSHRFRIVSVDAFLPFFQISNFNWPGLGPHREM